MKILICGDREWKDPDPILQAILRLEPDEIIHGGARGADRCADRVARRLGYTPKVFKANWDLYGKAAGPIRNQKMLDEGKPDHVLAFHANIAASKGTADMVRRARKAGIPTEVIKE